MQLAIENLSVIGKELAIRWNNGTETYLPLELLRRKCPCALCAGEKDLLGNVHVGEQKQLTPVSFELKRCDLVGGYGIQPHWMDGHGSGIFSFALLLAIASGAGHPS
jgi:DUF971 family protein